MGAFMVLLVVAGCSYTPTQSQRPEPYVPDMAAVVADRSLVGKDLVFRLEGGRQFAFPANGNYLADSQPDKGDLLVSGVRGDRWVYRITLREADTTLVPSDCFAIFGSATQDATRVFQTVVAPDTVIVFPRSSDWKDEGLIEGTNKLAGIATCINGRGEAFQRTY